MTASLLDPVPGPPHNREPGDPAPPHTADRPYQPILSASVPAIDSSLGANPGPSIGRTNGSSSHAGRDGEGGARMMRTQDITFTKPDTQS